MFLILAVHDVFQILTVLILLHDLIDFHQFILADPAVQVCDFFQAGNLTMLMLLHSLIISASRWIIQRLRLWHSFFNKRRYYLFISLWIFFIILCMSCTMNYINFFTAFTTIINFFCHI